MVAYLIREISRIDIYLSAELQERLAEYRKREWGGLHSLLDIVQKSIREFLDKKEEKKAVEPAETKAGKSS